MPDGEDLDAYCLGWDIPIKVTRGKVIAVIHRLDDDDDKLVVAKSSVDFNKEQIEDLISSQEKYFKHIIYKFK